MPGVIARFELGRRGFAEWLDRWRALSRNGWSVTVLLSTDESHAIGLGWREVMPRHGYTQHREWALAQGWTELEAHRYAENRVLEEAPPAGPDDGQLVFPVNPANLGDQIGPADEWPEDDF